MRKMNWKFSVILVVVAINVVCFGLWSVHGFAVSPRQRVHICVLSPLPFPSETCYRKTAIAAKENNDDSEEKSIRARTGQFFSKVFQGDKKKEKRPKKPKTGNKGESLVDRFVKRVTRDKKDEGVKSKENEQDGDKPQLTEAWESLEENLLEFKKRINNIRAEDAGEGGVLLSPEAEQKRINELRRAAVAKRQQQLREEKRRKEEAKAQARAEKEAEREAAERAKRIAKEKRELLKKQKEQRERQQRIQAAAAAKQARVEDKEARKGEDAKERSTRNAAQKLFKGVMDNFEKKEEWIVVGPKIMMAPGEIVPVTAKGLDLLIIASKDGRYLYCVANSCPHLGTPLETGLLEQRPSDPRSRGGPCEDCIVCPLHKTAFALESGDVRGEWCPYPPVIGKMTGAIKTETPLAVFDVRARGKNIEVRINSSLDDMDKKKEKR